MLEVIFISEKYLTNPRITFFLNPSKQTNKHYHHQHHQNRPRIYLQSRRQCGPLSPLFLRVKYLKPHEEPQLFKAVKALLSCLLKVPHPRVKSHCNPKPKSLSILCQVSNVNFERGSTVHPHQSPQAATKKPKVIQRTKTVTNCHFALETRQHGVGTGGDTDA